MESLKRWPASGTRGDRHHDKANARPGNAPLLHSRRTWPDWRCFCNSCVEMLLKKTKEPFRKGRIQQVIIHLSTLKSE